MQSTIPPPSLPCYPMPSHAIPSHCRLVRGGAGKGTGRGTGATGDGTGESTGNINDGSYEYETVDEADPCMPAQQSSGQI